MPTNSHAAIQKKSVFIYGNTSRESRIWTNFLASPDLERSLTKTKIELRQPPNASYKNLVLRLFFPARKAGDEPRRVVWAQV